MGQISAKYFFKIYCPKIFVVSFKSYIQLVRDDDETAHLIFVRDDILIKDLLQKPKKLWNSQSSEKEWLLVEFCFNWKFFLWPAGLVLIHAAWLICHRSLLCIRCLRTTLPPTSLSLLSRVAKHYMHTSKVNPCKKDNQRWGYSTVERFEKIGTKIKGKNKELTIFWDGEDLQALAFSICQPSRLRHSGSAYVEFITDDM